MGRRCKERQPSLWLAADQLGSGPRDVFYEKLNELLAEIGFDEQLEVACEPYYALCGRQGLAPGVYFCMLFSGFFEDISSRRGIAWRCEDSRSLARFLGLPPGEGTPAHSTLSLTRERLPISVHRLARELILSVANNKGLLQGKTIGVDASDLEANASTKSIVRLDTGDDWREYLCTLYAEETGDNDPTDVEGAPKCRTFQVLRFQCGIVAWSLRIPVPLFFCSIYYQRVRDQEWKSLTREDARVGRMQDGRTHLKYKVENAVDLETELILAAEVYAGGQGNTQTVEDRVVATQTNVAQVVAGCEIQEVVSGKGYHNAAFLDHLQHAAPQVAGEIDRSSTGILPQQAEHPWGSWAQTAAAEERTGRTHVSPSAGYRRRSPHLAVRAERLRLRQLLVDRLMAAWRSAHQVVAATRRNESTASVAFAA